MAAGSKVRLTHLRDEDSEALFRWINDRDLVVLNAPFKRVSPGEHARWFDEVRRRLDIEIFGIRLGDGALIGSCQLNAIDPARGECSLQIRIGEREAWGRGYGAEAVRLLLTYAFDELGLSLVRLEVFEDNERAINAYRKAGFREQGIRPRAAVIEGKPVDAIVMVAERGS